VFFDHFPQSGYVCAHRGARAHAPENTMLAAQRGLEFGADYWELDVHKVADGTLVVFHDDVLDRTTDIATHPDFSGRRSRRIHDYTWGELQKLDAGSWFITNDPFGTIAAGEMSANDLDLMRGQRIPSLKEALTFSRKHNLPVNVEIKDQSVVTDDLSIVGDVVDVVYEMNVQDLVLISSFNHDYLAEIKARYPEIPVAVLVENKHPKDIVAYLQRFGCTCYHPDHRMIDVALVTRLMEHRIRVAPYTVNDMDRAVSLAGGGCFGVITDYPLSLRQRLSR